MIVQNVTLEMLELMSDAFQLRYHVQAIAFIFDHLSDIFEMCAYSLNLRQAGFVLACCIIRYLSGSNYDTRQVRK